MAHGHHRLGGTLLYGNLHGTGASEAAMGKIRVVEGTIQEIGREKVTEGEGYEISFIKINGERIRDVGCEKFLRTFLKLDTTVRISIAKGWFAHEIVAIQLSDGEVLKGSPNTAWANAIQIYFLSVFVLACASYGLIYKDLWIAYFAWVFGGSAVIARFFTGYRLRARRALDGGPPPLTSQV
ncbi:hypothetical protein FA146_22890 [Pseudomonas aeruginosa]|nr:hypothetical protein [Pseudomonas aeruginosa]